MTPKEDLGVAPAGFPIGKNATSWEKPVTTPRSAASITYEGSVEVCPSIKPFLPAQIAGLGRSQAEIVMARAEIRGRFGPKRSGLLSGKLTSGK